MAESQCLFESRYVSLYTEKDRLTDRLSQLEKEMEEVRAQAQCEQERREALSRTEQEVSSREDKVSSLGNTSECKEADLAQLSKLQVQHKALSAEIDSQSKAIEAEAKSNEALQASIHSLHILLEEKNKAALELAERTKDANERLTVLENKRLGLVMSLEETTARTAAASKAVLSVSTETKALLGKLNSDKVELEQEFQITERGEVSPESFLRQEEARARSVHLSALECDARLEKLSKTRSDTRSKRLELTHLLSKVQAKLLLAKGTRENKEKSKAAFFIQRQEREVQVRRLRDQKEAAQQRKHSLEQEMDRLESEFDSLQVHLIACVQREHRVTDSKSRHLEQLKALRERKEQQVSDFKALKAQKQEILAKELQVETLQSKILQLKQELKQRAAESVTSASDLDTQLTRLNSEDERWQRCYRAEQEKLKQQAEFLRVKEKRLSRTNSPRSG
jgi:hypothetical protein